jgi:hypothetical protein
MRTVLAIALVLLVAGPFRRRLLANWRFLAPAALGAALGYVLAGLFVRSGGPGWLLVFAPVLFALQLGAAGKGWLDRSLGPQRVRRR